MDEDVKKAIEGINGQIQILAALYNDLAKRLDAVQDLAITVASFSRMTERVLADHLSAFAAAAAEPATKPARPGPEVG